jgi:hypothetical protein
MIAVIRVLITGVFLYFLVQEAKDYPRLSDLNLLFLAAYALVGGVFVAIWWVPVVGTALSEPFTSTFTEEAVHPSSSNTLVRLIHRLQARHHHRLALMICFLEGLRYPDLPHPPLLALRSVKPGSYLERCFAREVYRYHNVQNCLHACLILVDRHGLTPPPHPVPEVRLALLQSQRGPTPEPTTLVLSPKTKPAGLKRNREIVLFDP